MTPMVLPIKLVPVGRRVRGMQGGRYGRWRQLHLLDGHAAARLYKTGR